MVYEDKNFAPITSEEPGESVEEPETEDSDEEEASE